MYSIARQKPYLFVMPPQPMLQQKHLCFALPVAVSIPYSVRLILCQTYFFRFARKNTERLNSREIITAMSRLNNFVLGEIGTGTMYQDTTEYSNQRQSVLQQYQMLAPSEWIHKFYKFYCSDSVTCRRYGRPHTLITQLQRSTTLKVSMWFC